MAEVILGEEDRGKQIEVAPGSLVRLRLPENPSTGYRWELESFEGGKLEIRTDQYQPPATLVPGASGVRVFDFIAQMPGTVLLRLKYTRPWEPKDAAETYSVSVLVSHGQDSNQ